MALIRHSDLQGAVTVEEVRNHARLMDVDDEAYLEGLILAATEFCENWQRRSYVSTLWHYYLDGFPPQPFIRLDKSPLQEDDFIMGHFDTSDNFHEFSSDNYYLDTVSEPGFVILNSGASWPSTNLRRGNGVGIQFQSGHGEVNQVPMIYKQGVLLLVAHWYENREAVATTGAVPKDIPFSLKALLNQKKVYI